MPYIFTPFILLPDFTWPCPVSPVISRSTPPTPSVPSRISRRIWGYVHRGLRWLAEYYARWFSLEMDYNVIQLPFGLVLKWTDRTRLEEALAMGMARKAGMPVPRVLSCGDHPYDPLRKFSILMTRLPGWPLNNSDETLDLEAEEPWLGQLKDCLDTMRSWKSPFGDHRVYSVKDSSIKSARVPRHLMGPFENEEELHEYLLSTRSDHAFKSREEFEQTLIIAKQINDLKHRIVFTHGDLLAHNILIDKEGSLSGILDWESAGWCPEYWDFTTMMRWGKDSWWYQVHSHLGGHRYLDELRCDKAINKLTVDSYIF